MQQNHKLPIDICDFVAYNSNIITDELAKHTSIKAFAFISSFDISVVVFSESIGLNETLANISRNIVIVILSSGLSEIE